jgi:hypothetical protein
MIGEKGTGAECGNYKTYSSLGIYQTSGGYRVIGDNHVHPCGFPMLSILKGILNIHFRFSLYR